MEKAKGWPQTDGRETGGAAQTIRLRTIEIDLAPSANADGPLSLQSQTSAKIPNGSKLNGFLCAFSLLGSAAIAWFCVHYGQLGFDFTDEGFYLTWIADPGLYRANIPLSFFGFAYHPLYQLTSGNLVALRVANVGITLALAWILSALVLAGTLSDRQIAPLSLLSLAAGLAATASTYFALWWLVTPSYNSLAFQGMLVTFIGLVEARNWWSNRSILGWALIASGGWLVFLGKPSTAAILAPLVLIQLLATGRRDIRVLAATAMVALLLLLATSVLIDGSPLEFARRILRSIDLLKVLGSGQEFAKIFRVDSLPVGEREYQFAFVIVAGLVGGGLLLAYSFTRLAAGLLVVLAGLASAVLLAWDQSPVIRFSACLFIAVPVAAAGLSLLRIRSPGVRRVPLGLVIVFLLSPHIYAFGTNGNYWALGSAVAFFWVMAGTIVFAHALPVKAVSAGLFGLVALLQLLTAALLVQASESPYRQEHSLRRPLEGWNLRDQGVVMVSAAFHDYLATAREKAAAGGFQKGVGMIDLTGRSPGLLYDLGARSLGQPWLVGAYPGSEEIAISTLRDESCEALASAWLLIEPEGPRRLTTDRVLASWGASLSQYELVASFPTATYAGGFAEPYYQQIYKPSGPASALVELCNQARLTSPQLN